jgi:hypothetical protein
MTIPLTYFAPAERIPIEIIHRQAGQFQADPLLLTVLNGVFGYTFILNAQRQIVFASRNVSHLLPDSAAQDIIGLRVGEALQCIHARQCESGCGTSPCCRHCAAVNVFLKALEGCASAAECRITRSIEDAEECLDLLIQTTPFQKDGDTFLLVAAQDISHEKRRHALERLFFHDVLNLADGSLGLIKNVKEGAGTRQLSDLNLLHSVINDICEEIRSQRDLNDAEQECLNVAPGIVDSNEVLYRLSNVFHGLRIGHDKQIAVDPGGESIRFITDPVLLNRVLGNLVKNALEAIQAGQTVRIACAAVNGSVRFSVHNPGCIPQNLQHQIFHRSFTTKGKGHGLGLYSVRLICTRYLEGNVGFHSTPGEGTLFHVTLPRILEPPGDESLPGMAEEKSPE